jgi:hypothetical protein
MNNKLLKPSREWWRQSAARENNKPWPLHGTSETGPQDTSTCPRMFHSTWTSKRAPSFAKNFPCAFRNSALSRSCVCVCTYYVIIMKFTRCYLIVCKFSSYCNVYS